ncbi:hypothetical protein O7634_03485 [Micromonospora sp. WMMD1120]|uniref:hypothetical protein n=1 Tax=Micromonospora sp. WMMD1120 TaxID=3016106 RepID=UPI002416B322|nr:hypothetical protein [Micromonospora sp. WMMD1120]MDG4805815.1 hypothetical protein [Micromonospora sp. WMMD1120]
MSSDLDQQLAAALRRRAGGDVDPTPMVEHALQHGRRLRRRRRGLLAGAVAAACVAVTSLVMVVWAGRTGDHPILPATALLLPDASTRAGALARPGEVGADPATVHFTTDPLIGDAEYATWRAGRGTESVEFRGPGGQARFALARSEVSLNELPQTLSSAGTPQPRVDVRVGELPGVAWFDPSGDRKLWFIRWQPADGLWAQLDAYASTSDEAIGTAGRVRFDVAHRCVVPFRLESLPRQTRPLECSVTLGRAGRDVFVEGAVVVGDDSGRWLTVRAQRTRADRGVRPGELAAGPYRVRRQGDDVLEMTVRQCAVEAFRKGWGEGYTEAEGLAILGGYRAADDLDRPDTW